MANSGNLWQAREIQQVHCWNMCLAASKFCALKLLGFISPDKHLNDFINSPWARAHSSLPLRNAWGWTMTEFNDVFNREVLPAALNEQSAAVMNTDGGHVDARYDFFHHQTAFADHLLLGGTPLVVGVGLGGPAQEHHIVVVKAASGGIWAIDPWPGPHNSAIKQLPNNFSFSRGHVIALTSDPAVHIPCNTQVIGYYRDADYESRYVFSVR
jgi:hypothetical protein